MAAAKLLFSVRRRCAWGACPHADGACDCWDPTVYVGVDELTPEELLAFTLHGSLEQLDEILDWLSAEYAGDELLAGRSDRAPIEGCTWAAA